MDYGDTFNEFKGLGQKLLRNFQLKQDQLSFSVFKSQISCFSSNKNTIRASLQPSVFFCYVAKYACNCFHRAPYSRQRTKHVLALYNVFLWVLPMLIEALVFSNASKTVPASTDPQARQWTTHDQSLIDTQSRNALIEKEH